jgi:hypothetical protein
MHQDLRISGTTEGLYRTGVLKLNMIATEPMKGVVEGNQEVNRRQKRHHGNNRHHSRRYHSKKKTNSNTGLTVRDSPNLTADGTRSDFTTGQGGRPILGCITDASIPVRTNTT